MDFSEYLIKKFGYNEPIMSGEIIYKNYSKPWIRRQLGELCSSGKLVRFEKGIYYIPAVTRLGPSRLDPMKVIERKYIRDGSEQIGYYSGVSFMSMTGLSVQIPNTVEIYTNSEKSKVRQVKIGNIDVIIRRPRIRIDSSNAAVQSFLELMNSAAPSFFNRERRQIISEYIQKYRIRRDDIIKYAPFFPDRALRSLIESGIIYCASR